MSEPAPRRVPIEPGLFTVPDSPVELPRLRGSRCRACGEHFFPRRVVCARCLAQTLDDVLLGPRGTLYTWTYVHVPMFGKLDAQAAGYGVGQIDLPEGPRVQCALSGRPGDFHIGMEMELELEPLRTTSQGEQLVSFRFHPARPGVARGEHA
jgi:uncharacterized OB-fold protein